MSPRAYAIVVIGALVALLAIVRQVRLRRLGAKYALLWFAVGLAFLVLAVVPNMLDRLARLAGIEYPPALLMAAGIGFFALLSLHFSSEITRLEERTRVLAEEAALLRDDVAGTMDRAAVTPTPVAVEAQATAVDRSTAASAHDPQP
jgi:hypothetical protein